MSAKTHLWKEETVVAEDTITLSTIIECPQRGRCKLWYRIPVEFSSLLSASCDPFVIANIFVIMSEGADCVVHDQVSPSLLRNLAEFQAAWACWRPNKYKQVEIIAESEREEQPAEPPASAIASFSGGVDSCFTMFRHRMSPPDTRWRRDVEAGLFVHGFDIPLEHEEAFQRAADRIRQTLASVGAKLITMSTNLQALNIEWDDTHIAGLASSLMLLKRRYAEGLIASGCAYDKLLIPWGSNPMTDHLLSSDSFQIVHDGASVKRVQKMTAIADWTEGFENLRVCYLAQRRDENCGECFKCACDILVARVNGAAIPPSFPPLSDRALSKLSGLTDRQLEGLKSLVQKAKKKGIRQTWVNVLSRRLKQLEQLSKSEKRSRLPITERLRWLPLMPIGSFSGK